MEFLLEYGYAGLFASAFLAATILPLSSEIVLSGLLLGGLDPVTLVTVATAGNVLGSLTNYGIGYSGGEFFKRKIATASEEEINSSLARYEKYGAVSLLFAWVPIIGDPLTVAAGVLRMNLCLFMLLVTIGKLGRYVVLAFFMPVG